MTCQRRNHWLLHFPSDSHYDDVRFSTSNKTIPFASARSSFYRCCDLATNRFSPVGQNEPACEKKHSMIFIRCSIGERSSRSWHASIIVNVDQEARSLIGKSLVSTRTNQLRHLRHWPSQSNIFRVQLMNVGKHRKKGRHRCDLLDFRSLVNTIYIERNCNIDRLWKSSSSEDQYLCARRRALQSRLFPWWNLLEKQNSSAMANSSRPLIIQASFVRWFRFPARHCLLRVKKGVQSNNRMNVHHQVDYLCRDLMTALMERAYSSKDQ